MLEEVRQTLLVVVLLDSTYIVIDVELGHTLWLLVMTDVVCQSVRQYTLADLLVSWQGLRGVHLGLRCEGHAHHQGYDQK